MVWRFEPVLKPKITDRTGFFSLVLGSGSVSFGLVLSSSKMVEEPK